MNWQRWFCTNQACADWAWMVLRDPTIREVWCVAAHEEERPFTIAATDPICPRCGTALLTPIELEGRLARQIGAEAEPALDFMHSLA